MSDNSFDSVGLCFGLASRFLFSWRRTGGGEPSTSRATDFTAVVARNFWIFFFFGKDRPNLPRRHGDAEKIIFLLFSVTLWLRGRCGFGLWRQGAVVMMIAYG